jgi:hypothetical protein
MLREAGRRALWLRLFGRRAPWWGCEEAADLDVHDLGDDPPRRDAGDAVLVPLGLPARHADRIGQILLDQPGHAPPLTRRQRNAALQAQHVPTAASRARTRVVDHDRSSAVLGGIPARRIAFRPARTAWSFVVRFARGNHRASSVKQNIDVGSWYEAAGIFFIVILNPISSRAIVSSRLPD